MVGKKIKFKYLFIIVAFLGLIGLLTACSSGDRVKEKFYASEADFAGNVAIGSLGTGYTLTLNGLPVGAGGGMIPLTSGHIYVGNAGNVATDVAASGDLTLDNTGKFTVTGLQDVALPVLSTGYLYYDAGAWSFEAGGGGVTSVTASAPILSSGGTTPDISLDYDTGTLDVSGGKLTVKSGVFLGVGDNAASATYASNVTIADDTTNATMYPTWVTTNTGNIPLYVTSGNLTYNPSTGVLSATTFDGDLSGNASSATYATSAGSAGTATNATNAANIAITDDTTTNATMYPVWVTTNTGDLPPYVSSAKLSFNPSTGILTSTGFAGDLTGDVTGDVSGNAGTVTGLNVTAGKTLTVTDDATISGTPITNPMTTLGDIIYGGALGAVTRLAGDTTDARTFLTSLSVGGTATAPVWSTLTNADVGLGNVENTALSTWAGSANIVTVGTIGAGKWQGDVVAANYGGTGVANNVASTITITGAHPLGLTLTADTSVTLPTSGTLATLAGAETITNKVSYNGLVVTANTGVVTTGTWNGSLVAGQYGGTGVANTGKTITLGGNFTTSGAFTTTLTVTGNTNVTLPTTGTLATLAGTEVFTNKTLTTPIVQVSLTAGEAIAQYDACYVKADGKVYKAKADDPSTMKSMLIAQAAVNNAATGNFMCYGYITNGAWAFTPGATLYVSEVTAGLVTSTAPSNSGDQVQVVGVAITATQICWCPAAIVFELE